MLSTHLDQALDSQCEQGSNSLSLPIALNAVVGSFFWLGGLCKVTRSVPSIRVLKLLKTSRKVFADVCQMGGPVLIKVHSSLPTTHYYRLIFRQSIINFAKERSRARDNGTQEPPLMKGLLLAGSLLLFTVATSLIHHQVGQRARPRHHGILIVHFRSVLLALDSFRHAEQDSSHQLYVQTKCKAFEQI